MARKQCPECSTTFRTESGLLWHTRNLHRVQSRHESSVSDCKQTANTIVSEINSWPENWVREARAIAVNNGITSWPYIRGILRNWQQREVRPQTPDDRSMDVFPMPTKSPALPGLSEGIESGTVGGVGIEEFNRLFLEIPRSVDRLKEHERVKQALADLGYKHGFDVRMEYIMPSLGPHGQRRIDLCWLKNGTIAAAFEVDYRTPKKNSLDKLRISECKESYIVLRRPHLRFLRIDRLSSIVLPGKVWMKVLTILKKQVMRSVYDTWLAKTRGLELDNGCFIVGAEKAYVLDALNTRFRSLIQKTLGGVLGQEDIKLEFRVIDLRACVGSVDQVSSIQFVSGVKV